jgi:hypothetical protein
MMIRYTSCDPLTYYRGLFHFLIFCQSYVPHPDFSCEFNENKSFHLSEFPSQFCCDLPRKCIKYSITNRPISDPPKALWSEKSWPE